MRKLLPLFLFFLASLLVSNAVALPVGGGPVGGTGGPPLSSKTPLGFTSCFVDPANVSTHASDANTCATSSVPIRTTAQLNTRLWNRLVTGATTITYMSDDASGTMLDLSTVTIDGAGSLTFNGTPQVLHTGGTLNAGTIPINPTAASGGQRQVGHTSDLAAFAPFVIASLSGAAAHPAYILDTTGGNNGTSAWVVTGLAATASLSRPMQSDNATNGTLTIGDSYKIQRGSTLVVGGNASVNPGSNGVTFNDIAFSHAAYTNQGSFIAFYNRCSFDAPVLAPLVCNNCYVAGDLSFASGGAYFMSAGVWLLAGGNTGEDVIEVTNDVYVTGTGPSASLFADTNGYGNVTVLAGNVAHSGIQLQDLTGTAAIIVGNSAPITTGQNGTALIWGNGNAGFGMAIQGGAQILVPASVGDVPSVTGTGGDFEFLGVSNASITNARAWDDSVGAFTTTRTTTWAHLTTSIAGGGFGNNAQCVQCAASIISN